jgi:hypothetical protein
MIKIERDLQKLEQDIDALVPTWRSRAQAKTDEFIRLGRYEESSPIWSEIKVIFSKLQNNRCLYCQRSLAGTTFGSGEHDLEHFRPKGRVSAYPSPSDSVQFSFPTGSSQASGYYWLAYHLENYAVACISCNRGLKADGFPISNTRGIASTGVTDLNVTEQPLLIFPFVEDPEDFIGFFGVTPKPKFKRGLKYRRALVTISFFALADERREELYRERFKVISELWSQYNTIQESRVVAIKQKAQVRIKTLCDPESEHSACARAFYQLLESDPERAWDIYEAAVEYPRRK